MTNPLQPEFAQRYARHLILPEVGRAGQERLRASSVLMVGAGGLGSPAALYLAAAGLGTIGVVDSDRVELSNLQRQVLHGTQDIGRSKVESAAERIGEINPTVEVVQHPVRLTSGNALDLFRAYDLVIDGSDNFPTRYLVNDAGVLTGRPVVYGSVERFEGQCSVFGAAGGPCYRCLFAEPPPAGMVPSCAEAGVLGVMPGLIGTLQALEAIKVLLGVGETLAGRLLIVDALRLRFREIAVPRDPECPVCGEHPTVTSLIDYDHFCGTATKDDDMMNENAVPEITATELKERMDAGEDVPLLDVREPHEWEIGNLGPKGARLIPLGELAERANEVEAQGELVVYCRSGARSERAARFLRSRGVDAKNLTGGILAWSDEVDPEMPKY